jgi:exosortase D (VPLPA-CTERM-specific)
MYWDVCIDLIEVWNNKEEYSYGFMIPFVSGYFLWQKKSLLLAEKITPSIHGYFLITLSLLAYFVGSIGDVFFLLRFSFIFLLIGLTLLIFGYKITKISLVPILLLIFSFPLPADIQASLTAKLQLLSSQLGVSFIRLCDIPVYLEGNVIDLGSYQLQVVEACSGLRYLFPLMSLSFICAYLYQVAFWKRAVIFLTSIPITIGMNSFRIGIIGLLVQYWGISMAEGFIHDFEGWIVFMVCFAILFSEMWLLSWTERKTHSWEDVFGLIVHQPEATAQSERKINLTSVYIVIGILVATTVFIKPLRTVSDFIPPRKDFTLFPNQFSEWHGVRDALDKHTIEFLGLSDYVLINFANNARKEINFYVAYYQTQRHGMVPHSPKLCIPGGGWQIKDIQESAYQGVKFNRVLIEKDKVRQLVYYWYKQKDENIANEYYLKWNTFLGSLENRRTDVALIRLTTLLNPNDSIEMADQRLQSFMLLANNSLSEYIPN